MKQKLAAPTLALPPQEAKEAPKKEAGPAPEEPALGPRTSPAEAPSGREPPKGPLAMPAAPGELALPHARLEGDVSALPAPALSPSEEAPKEAPEAIRYEPRLVTSKTNVNLLIDASGSMSAPLGISAESKFDVMRKALYGVIYEMRQQQADFPRNISIRLFGAGYDASENNCEDSSLAVGMGEPDADAIRASLDKVVPRGQSPIAYAISRAADDFPGGLAVERVMVLVADGWDTCEADPCSAAGAIDAGPVKTAINVVAFDVSAEDQQKLACITEKTDGRLFVARNEAELAAALDQAINSTVPYNLKLSAQAGGMPLPFTVDIYEAGTSKVVRHGESLGTKLLNLPPGTYDILIEYTGSPEPKKPSKMLKGVEILATTRVEQTINFDLARVSLTALSSEGRAVPAIFKITRDAGKEEIATIETEAAPISIFLPPGTYDMAADLVEAGPEAFTVVELGVKVGPTEQPELSFVFQKGTLAIKGVTTLGQPIPFIFHAFKSGTRDLVASGALPSEGGSAQLAPGNYDFIVMGEDPGMIASPRTKIGGVAIKAGETTELTAIFEMGTVKLSAIDGKGNPVPSEFILKDEETGLEMMRAASPAGAPAEISVPPGTYSVTAYSTKSILEPKPSVTEEGLVVAANQPTSKVIQFVLGTLRLRGRNVKESPVRTEFTLYKAASDEVAAKAPPSNDWMVFDLSPGLYDALAVDMTPVTGEGNVTPMIWIRDIKIEDGKTVSHEAIFTAGKLKIIGRGANNRIISCSFRVFRYATDTPLITGQTTNDWEIFEIDPGKYYVEASYSSEEQDVTLKKWVNLDVGENEIVELVLRF
ncbi:MAG: VWA domain-containing protein [Proteobacteria bacterium]|nr:VWA domain-containing protein [Pseudomonadota bacterium]